MTVQEARLRAATTQEATYERGGSIWRYSMYPLHVFNRLTGIFQLLYYRTDFLNVQTPHVLRATHAITRYFGITPEREFLRDLPCFGNSHHQIMRDTKVMDALYLHHRNDDLFVVDGGGVLTFLEILQRIFPDEKFTKDDFVLTCSKLKSPELRKLISDKMVSVEYTPLIDAEITSMLDRFAATNGPINFTKEARLLASSIILKVIFGQTVHSEELTNSVHYTSRYIIQSMLGLNTEEDEERFKISADVFRKTSLAMLNDAHFPELEGLSKVQKLAFIFGVFFAGQETSSTLLTHIIYTLGKDPKEQQELRRDLSLQRLTELFTRSIKQFPPFFQVSRTLKVDACLEFKMEGDPKVHKLIIPAGDSLSAEIYHSSKHEDARFLPFGHHIHECPGQMLAKREVKDTVKKMMERFEFQVVNARELKLKPSVILEYNEDVLITVKPIESLLEPIV